MAALPNNGGTIHVGPGVWTFGNVVLPNFPKVVNVECAGHGQTIFTPNAANTPLFISGSGSGVISRNEIGGFTVLAHPSGSTGTALELSGARNTRWWDIEYQSNGTGNYASLFHLASSPRACYGNVIDRPRVESQSGPTTIILFDNGGTSNSAYNCNIARIIDPWFYGNTGITTCIDARRSANVSIIGGEFEANAGATGIIPGQNCTIMQNWLEALGGSPANSLAIVPQSGADGSSNDVTVIGNYLSGGNLTIPSGISSWKFVGNSGAWVLVDNANCAIIERGNSFQFNVPDGIFTLKNLAAGANQWDFITSATGSSLTSPGAWMLRNSTTGKRAIIAYGNAPDLSLQLLVGGPALGLPAPVTTATAGFPYIPVMAGAPTGVPTVETGYSPIVFDSTNLKLWVYTGSAWKGVVLS
jgi:hypothetical protein